MKRSGYIKRHTPLRKVSPKRARQNREYSVRRKAFLAAHPWCQVWLAEHDRDERDVKDGVVAMWSGDGWGINWVSVPRSEEIHHRAGRIGAMLNDESEWLAVSRESHNRIHQRPSWARAKGYLK